MSESVQVVVDLSDFRALVDSLARLVELLEQYSKPTVVNNYCYTSHMRPSAPASEIIRDLVTINASKQAS